MSNCFVFYLQVIKKSKIRHSKDFLAYYIQYSKVNPHFVPKTWYDLNSKFYSLFIFLKN